MLRRARGRGGENLANLAKILHDGTTIKVTPAMRALFQFLAQVSEASRGRKAGVRRKRTSLARTKRARRLAEIVNRKKAIIKPLSPSTTQIVIPPRPYFKKPLADKKLHREMSDRWNRAIEKALTAKV